MKKNFKGYVSLGLITIFAVMSFLYTAPEAYTGTVGRTVSASFISPWLKQNWQLFGPNVPGNNYEIELLVDGNKKLRIIEDIASQHRSTYFLHYGKMAVGLYNFCSALDHEISYYGAESSFHRDNLKHVVIGVLKYLNVSTKHGKIKILRNNKVIHQTEWDEMDR